MFNFHYKLERNAIGLVLAIVMMASIGGAALSAGTYSILDGIGSVD